MPEKIPEDVSFIQVNLSLIQTEMIKTYKLAYEEAYPRFLTAQRKKDKNNRVPYSLNKEKWQDERKIRPVSAWSNSIFSVKMWWWTKTYEPQNVIKPI